MTMAKQKNFDVFLSYRRQDGIYPAYLLYRALTDDKYDVFLDKISIGAGPFPAQLENAIDTCRDFLILATKEYFSKRIFQKNDWVRKEIELALKRKDLNIVILFLDEISFPRKLPKEIDAIRNYQCESLHGFSHGEAFLRSLFGKYLVSPKKQDFDYAARQSIYDLHFDGEKERLNSQGRGYRKENLELINEHTGNAKGLSALDVGCANGDITFQTYSGKEYKFIDGIDFSGDAIREASKIDDPRFRFHNIDIDAPDFLLVMKNIMKQRDIEGYDVISCFLVLHHLKDPEKALRNLKALLKKGGLIIVRGSDDGSKLSYGDDGLIDKVIDLSYKVSGVSDRQNGRKLYSYLVHAGFKEVLMHCKVIDTSVMDFERRQHLFNVSFSWRIGYFRKLLEEDPSEENLAKFNEMEEALSKLQSVFARNDFWYAVTRYVATGIK